MTNRRFVKYVLYGIALILLGMLVSLSFAKSPSPAYPETKMPTQPSKVSLRASENVAPVGTAASVAQTFVSCTPVEVMTYGNRVHVRCAAAISGIRFFAVSTVDAQNAARILSVLSTAQVAGRTLTILYDPADLSGASFGCLTSDCRVIRAVGFGQ